MIETIMPELSQVARQPLYQQVRQKLLAAVQSGTWEPGEKIPTEPVLAKQLGVSIGTLRRAVETLVNDGVLRRREGVGTFVRTYRDCGYWNVFQIYRNLDGEYRGSYGRLITFELTDVYDEKIRIALNCQKGEKLIHMVRQWILAENGTEDVISVDESYLVAEKFQSLTKDFFLDRFQGSESLYEFFDREFKVVIISQKCSAHYERLDEATAQKLQVKPGFEALCTERISLTIGHIPVEYRINRGRVDVTKIFFDLAW